MLRLKPGAGRRGRANWDARVGWLAVLVSIGVWFIALFLIVIVVNALKAGIGLHPGPPP